MNNKKINSGRVTFLFSFILLTALTSCKKDSIEKDPDLLDGKGIALASSNEMVALSNPINVSTQIDSNLRPGELRSLKSFTRISLGAEIPAIVKIGNTEDIRFEGDTEAISQIMTEVKEGKLVISNKPVNIKKFNDYSSITIDNNTLKGKKITAYITVKNLSSLEVTGNGNLSVADAIVNTNNLLINVVGNGQVTANVNVIDLKLTIVGIGTINVSGKTQKSSINIVGAGSVLYRNFDKGDSSISSVGGGSVKTITDEGVKVPEVGSLSDAPKAPESKPDNNNLISEREKASEQARLEREKANVEREKALEQARLEREKANVEREKANVEREKASEQARLEREKANVERERALEQAKLEREKANVEREKALEKARLERERANVEREKALEKARLERERATVEREKARLERAKSKR